MGVAPTLVHKEAQLFDLADLRHGRATPENRENMNVSADSVKKKKKKKKKLLQSGRHEKAVQNYEGKLC